MSFGPKLQELPAEYSPGEEVIVTLEFTPQIEQFEQEIEIYVEEPEGIRQIKATVKSIPQRPAS